METLAKPHTPEIGPSSDRHHPEKKKCDDTSLKPTKNLNDGEITRNGKEDPKSENSEISEILERNSEPKSEISEISEILEKISEPKSEYYDPDSEILEFFEKNSEQKSEIMEILGKISEPKKSENSEKNSEKLESILKSESDCDSNSESDDTNDVKVKGNSKRFKVGSAETIGRRCSMEDRTVIFGSLQGNDQEDYFAVFDGHGGVDASNYSSSELHNILLTLLREKTSENDHSEKTSDNNPSEKTSENDPREKTSENNPGEKISEKDHSEKTSEKYHSEKTSEKDHSEKTSEKDHREKTSEKDHSEKTSENNPGEKTSEKDHSEKTSDPSEKISENIPGEKTSENIPGEKTSENNPGEKTSENDPPNKTPDIVSICLKEAFTRCNESMKSLNTCNETGTTAVVVYSKGTQLWVANAGDSRAVLSRGGQAVRVTTDHKPSLDSEKKRILDLRGFVFFGRVNGVLAVSRALGDFSFNPHVTCEPDIFGPFDVYDPENQFLILACDGLWDVIDDKEAVRIVMESGSPDKGLNEFAGELVNAAIRARSTDNVSVVVIFFPDYAKKCLEEGKMKE